MSDGRIAVLGIGRMGVHFARRLVRAGHAVTAWNRTREKAEPLLSEGIVVADTATEAVVEADFVILMLSDGAAVGEALNGGVAQSVKANSIVIDMSSIPPDLARTHAKLVRGGYLDAPVSGGTIGAEQGTLAIMVGGEPEHFAGAKPILEKLGRPTHVGPVGSGQLAKLCNQVIVATTIGAVAEALLLAKEGGADPAAVREALLGGFADSRILREHGQRMLARNFVPGGSVRHQVKDLNTALRAAQSSGLASLPVAERVRELFQGLEADGKGDLDHSALLLLLERLNGRPVD